ncbi:MAG: amino acid adenylation domain-containing protein [Cyanobacteria bacterium P01_F01_bin.150]
MIQFSHRSFNASSKRQALLKVLLEKEGLLDSLDQPIVARESNERLPLSDAQQQFWLLENINPGSPSYNLPYPLEITGTLDVDILRQCFTQIIHRHEILRTIFSTVDSKPVQVVLSDVSFTLPVIDLQHMGPVEQEEAVDRTTLDHSQQGFDLAEGPLLRTCLLQLSPTKSLLLLSVHHIVFDGWSFSVLLSELQEVYEKVAKGLDPGLSDLTVQYADYAIWQGQQSLKLESQLAYWTKQLSGTSPLLRLPSDRPRPSLPSFRGAIQTFELSRSLHDSLERLSQAEGVTLFMALLAAFKSLLYRYTGASDLLVGTPFANRKQSEVQNLIGPFINTVVLRTEFDDSLSFQQLLQQVRQVVLDAEANQDIPFDQVVQALQPQRDSSYNPLFQVMFVLQNAPLTASTVADLTFMPKVIDSGVSKFDLLLEVVSSPESGTSGWFEYSTDLFDSETISRLAGHFQVLLEGLVQNPQMPICELPLLTLQEQHQLIVEWNRTQVDYPEGQCLHHLFEAQVKRSLEAVAITFEGQQLTYQELNQRSNQLAAYLQTLGVKPNVLVGVFMERSLEMVIALFSILKAGGAYVPLDPAYPPERLNFILADAQLSVLLTQPHLRSRVSDNVAQLVCVERQLFETLPQPSADAVSALSAQVKPADAAYVIYTSGSTGQPKGVVNVHSGICNRLFWMQDAYQLNETDCVLQKTPFSFDVSVWEFFWPLFTGARLVIARPEGHKDSAYLIKLIATEGVTTLHFVPSMLQVFLDASGVEQCTSLKRVICSGEALPLKLQERFFTRLRANLYNLYGPTEAAIDVTHWHCTPEAEMSIVPIGRPIANTQIYLLDSQLQPVPIGVPGELHIGGAGLARGYLNRDDLSAAKFIPNPFSDATGERLYKTGDLARYLPDGTIEYLGRIDFQVKLNGYRIELGEVEAELTRFPTVKESIVLLREDDVKKYLVAYVVLSESATAKTAATADALKRHLRKTLPEYMVPNVFITLDYLPLTANGKVNRKALPEPKGHGATSKVSRIAPTSKLERALADIWQTALGVEKVGVNENFFDLGGHSLLLAQVQNQVQASLDKDIAFMTLFRYPTIHSLVRHLHDDKGPSNNTDLQSLAAKQKASIQRQKLLQRRVKNAPIKK